MILLGVAFRQDLDGVPRVGGGDPELDDIVFTTE